MRADAGVAIVALQRAGSAFFAFGIVGALLPEVLTSLRPATLYGRLLCGPQSPPTSLLARLSVGAQRLVQLRKGAAFTFFYAVAVLVNLVAMALAAAAAYPMWSLGLLAAFQVHVMRRLLECLFVHRFSAEARMPLLLVVAGALHYVFAPFALLPARGRAVYVYVPEEQRLDEEEERPASLVALTVGLALFIGGNAAQYAVHRYLADLRLRRDAPPPATSQPLAKEAPEDEPAVAMGLRRRRAGGAEAMGALASAPAAQQTLSAYPFPTSSLFLVSLSPHYTAEVSIYVGLCLARAGAAALADESSEGAPWAARLSAALLLAWVLCNLSVTAKRTRSWYTASYPDEPRAITTAAILPFIL